MLNYLNEGTSEITKPQLKKRTPQKMNSIHSVSLFNSLHDPMFSNHANQLPNSRTILIYKKQLSTTTTRDQVLLTPIHVTHEVFDRPTVATFLAV